ncbi:hypothetical protein PTTG_11886 [Puccinia triticina 1-1 BBBD Race 1]|uniref:DUF6589 domain-containing protein n=1 Tax=Puccinia triticina (isolate 1-1 / race 1 (BBBD)) TaxID=630390 RepID=A0A180GYN7_PUCT1|nr:hypothetical protein PTTG_11886 [Puccinia triticina 1-1 BBBD Race 1]
MTMCLQNLPALSDQAEKLLFIDQVLHAYNLDAKRFIQAYLQNECPKIKSNRRIWGAPYGWPSTMLLINTIKELVHKTTEGKARWSAYILSEAKLIIAGEGGAHGQFPKGNYYNSKKITPAFFSDEAKAARMEQHVTLDMPFLYNLILHKVQRDRPSPTDPAQKNTASGSDRKGKKQLAATTCDSGLDKGGNSGSLIYDSDTSDSDTGLAESAKQKNKKKLKTGDDLLTRKMKTSPAETEDVEEELDRKNRPHIIAATVCSMVAFGANRRDNALQIQNAVVLLACGVTERVSSYLNYIGLASSRRTAHRALSSLGRIAERTVIRKMGKSQAPLAPIICMDNIDFEESIHEKSVEKTTQMFHGTWGYLHVPDRTLIDKFDPKDFSLESFKTAIERSSEMKVQPSWFLPDTASAEHFRAVLKSQILRVLLEFLATPEDKQHPLNKDPPPIDPIDVKEPDITMFKLMIASDNSTEGVGEVLQGFLRQTDLSSTDFFSRLQVIDGDLATCMNVESLRAQRKPSGHVEEDLSAIVTLLGASHVLWNIAQSFFLLHFGNSSDSEDLGAWHTLQTPQ